MFFMIMEQGNSSHTVKHYKLDKISKKQHFNHHLGASILRRDISMAINLLFNTPKKGLSVKFFTL